VDWTPIRLTEHRFFKPFHAIGLDGTRIVAVQEILRHGQSVYTRLIEQAPDNSLFLIGGDYEMPERFIEGFYELKEMDENNPDISIEWIRVSDYLKKFPVTEEAFINNADLAGIMNWDSYSRWTADPYDIEVHTLTKKAMESLRAAKIAVFAGQEFARRHKLPNYQNPDIPVGGLQTMDNTSGITWDIEQAAFYPTVEPEYFLRNGEVTLLSRAEHLLAWAVNSDSRGWWPLYERRHERMESFENVIDISNELIERALNPIGSVVNIKPDLHRSLVIFNAEKNRKVIVEFDSHLPCTVVDADGKEFPTKIFRKGNTYLIRTELELPEYGYKVIGLKRGGEVIVPAWEEGVQVESERFRVKANKDHIEIESDGRMFKLSPDPSRLEY
jgi:hypothetical protein